MWINRKGKYPYVDQATWTTRVWLLIRKVDRQKMISTYSDRRVAIEMLRLAPKGAPAHLLTYLEEVLTNAAEAEPLSFPGSSASQAGMGPDDRDGVGPADRTP